MERLFRYYIAILGSLAVILAAAIVAANPYCVEDISHSAASVYVKNLLQGKKSTGVYSGRVNRLDFSRIIPGDILLAGDSESCYGHFTHAGIYMGEGSVMEGYVDCGISCQPIEHYRYYDWACILRVKVATEQRENAIQYAREQEYKTFYPVAFKSGEHYWNCTKLIWEAYLRQGVDLDSYRDLWVTPDSIYRSPYVEVIASEGEMPI